jgi:hypothetical protein
VFDAVVVASTGYGDPPSRADVLSTSSQVHQQVAIKQAPEKSGRYVTKDAGYLTKALTTRRCLLPPNPETLTEEAFTADRRRFDACDTGLASGPERSPRLSQSQNQQLSRKISEIKKAEQKAKSPELALAAVEGIAFSSALPKARPFLDLLLKA